LFILDDDEGGQPEAEDGEKQHRGVTLAVDGGRRPVPGAERPLGRDFSFPQ